MCRETDNRCGACPCCGRCSMCGEIVDPEYVPFVNVWHEQPWTFDPDKRLFLKPDAVEVEPPMYQAFADYVYPKVYADQVLGEAKRKEYGPWRSGIAERN